MQVNIDTRLKLLAGFPIEVENFGLIKPLTIRQVIETGYIKYMQYLHLFTLKKKDLLENIPPEETTELGLFDILLQLSNDEVLEHFRKALAFFMQDEVIMFKENNVVAVGKDETLRVINRDNFDDICIALQIQNGLLNIDGESITANDKAKAIQDRMREVREQVKKAKQKDGNDDSESDFFDLVSAISTKSNSINKFNILDLTIFQLYEELRRLSAIESYEMNVNAMMQGAKNINLVHWSQKLKI